MANDFTPLMQAIGYEFSEPSLLQRALTHRSCVNALNNERLEFLGDALLNSTIAKALYLRFEEATEGQMSRLRANLVCGATLKAIATELGLGPYLQLGLGERRNGGKKRASILADTLEAIIAAIFLDSDMPQAEAFILRCYETRLQACELTQENKDPKTILQEQLQAKKLPLPRYTVTAIHGQAHAQEFEVICEVPGLPFQTQGKGSSKRSAEQIAAAEFVVSLSKEAKHV